MIYPTTKKGFKTIVWFHGGGLEGGNKENPLHELSSFDHGTVLAPAGLLIKEYMNKP